VSLESQLNAKADKIFDEAYLNLFKDFSARFGELTGLWLVEVGIERIPESLLPLRKMVELSYYGSTTQARSVHDAARDLHRERYIKAFIAKAEELAAFTGNGEDSA
jgi:hypothetical protein